MAESNYSVLMQKFGNFKTFLKENSKSEKVLLFDQYTDAQFSSMEEEISKSYIEYAMSVIVSRALPDTRDGFKPVLRRILFAMYQMNNFFNQKHKKCARIV